MPLESPCFLWRDISFLKSFQEWDFIKNYGSIIRKTKYLLLEWHSWHSGGNGFPQIENKLKELGFKITKKTNSERARGRDGQVGLLLAENQHFQF